MICYKGSLFVTKRKDAFMFLFHFLKPSLFLIVSLFSIYMASMLVTPGVRRDSLG